MPAREQSESASRIEEIKQSHPLLFAAEEPPVGEMQKEFERAGGLSGALIQRERNDRIRFNRWPGRTSDYRKHRSALKKDPVPWEEASDARLYLADAVIEDLVDVLTSGFGRAQLKMKPTEATDIAKAGVAEMVLGKYRERMGQELTDEAEFLAQFGLNDGKSVWHVMWDRQVSMKEQRVTMEEVVGASVQAVEVLQSMPEAELGEEMLDKLTRMKIFPALIEDEQLESEAVELLQLFARDLAAQIFSEQRYELGESFLETYSLGAKKARTVIRELRETGQSSFPGPYLSRNQPAAVARRVGEDYFCPPEMTDVQSAPWHCVREFISPEEVMSRQVSEGWDYEWCLEVVASAGKTSMWGYDLAQRNGVTADGDEELDQYTYAREDSGSGLCEVLHFYKRYLTEEGLPQIYCTVFSPHCATRKDNPEESFFGKHYPYMELPDRYPFVGYRWQKKSRAFAQGMGVPQLVGSDQDAIKTSIDLLRDRQSIEVNPERIVNSRLGMRYKAGPGSQNSSNQYYGNRPLIEYAQPPTGNPALAFNLMEETHKRVDNYFGLMTERVLPAKWQAKLQRATERYLASCSEMWRLVFMLIQTNADATELERITSGAGAENPVTPEDLAGSYDVGLYFDVKDLDMEFVFKKIEAILKWAVPADRAGMIPMDRLVSLIMTAIDPTYAQILTQDKASASQKVFNETKDAIAQMYLGNAPELVENDPTAEMKLQFANQIIFGDEMGNRGNPKYQEALTNDPIFAQAMQTWQGNLQQSVTQEKNKAIGRLGVDPAEG